MKSFLLKFCQLVCVVLLITFVVFICTKDSISNQPFEKVESAVSDVCDLQQLVERDGLEVKKQFGIVAEEFSGFCYYSSDSVMDVRELFVIRYQTREQRDQLLASVKKYIEDKMLLFEGYAPKESELLEKHLLVAEKGYLLFYVGEDTVGVSAAFRESL